jgi:hypothetical protein
VVVTRTLIDFTLLVKNLLLLEHALLYWRWVTHYLDIDHTRPSLRLSTLVHMWFHRYILTSDELWFCSWQEETDH